MQIDLSVLFPRDGMKAEKDVPISMENVLWNHDLCPLTDKEVVKMTLSRTGKRAFNVKAEVHFSLVISCDRCMKPTTVPFSLEIDRDFKTFANDAEHTEELDEQPFVQGSTLDTDLLICDELFVNMPMKVLCRPDCKGLCPKCGADRNIRDCGCDTFAPDPRMAGILDLFAKSQKESS